MDPVAVSLAFFASVFGGSMLAMAFGRSLKPHHIAAESRDVVKLGIGMVSAMSALILGLIVSAVMASYNQTERDVQQYAASIVHLESGLRDHGPSADPIRADLSDFTRQSITGSWPSAHSLDAGAASTEAGRTLTRMGVAITELDAADAETARTKAASLTAFDKLQQDRWKIAIETYSSVNPTLIAILGVWLTLIFVSFGLFAPRNMITFLFLLACSASIGCAIYIILDLNTPFEGAMAITSLPLERALTHLQRP